MADMVDPHTRTHENRAMPPELFFACGPPPMVLLSWVVLFLALGSWDIELAGLAALVGLIGSALSPIGLGIAIRAARLPHPAEDRPAILFALIGNALVVIQLVVIIATLADRLIA
jgi:hypothetical protein